MPKLFHILLPGVLMITFNSTAGADGRTPATIEEALQERGWTVTRTFAGDLYLFAPSENGAAIAEITPAPTAKESSAEEIDLQTLGKKLEAAGWKVERKSDGALELRPQETTETITRKEEPAPSPADKQWKQIQKQLNAAGWNATRESDGSLVLIPPDKPVQATAPEVKATEPEKQADSMQTMQDKLRETGWQVTENGDGSILFYPPKQSHGEKGTIQPVRGHAPPADFKLPVTSWSQARNLALKWLKQQSPGNLTVGKIREIYDVYLVSILTNSRFDRLKHQIAVRRSDGHIIVLN